ncbi:MULTISPECIES: response regulator [unclassified Nocardioides]|uniref:response regulator n=1 Tax=unclassified Nocardioides TaxID=2615069 RepID=UPI0009F0959E|nr:MULTISPECIES: response regulator transcription factor [unclassified Nocardioides]GAW50387.1 two component LuxR family transcriptional regulator [Nocardioides sp. PD653-B2]GAW53109.1 two component LuxR family transcriptional regulator [Nocardioides sp. PD653]
MTEAAAPPIRVLVVDDHEMLATALARVLDEEPDMVSVGVAPDLARARSLIAAAAPDVVLLDHRLPDGDGVAALPELHALRPSARFVVLTASTADSVLASAIEGGAAGFVSKTRGLAEVTSAVRSAAQGEVVISPEMLARLLPRLRRGGRPGSHELTEREREVLGLLTEGLSNAAIAERMTVSVFTVRNHLANLSAKLGAHSKLEVLSIAIREGLVPGR